MKNGAAESREQNLTSPREKKKLRPDRLKRTSWLRGGESANHQQTGRPGDWSYANEGGVTGRQREENKGPTEQKVNCDTLVIKLK